jgi:hypothetical protein
MDVGTDNITIAPHSPGHGHTQAADAPGSFVDREVTVSEVDSESDASSVHTPTPSPKFGPTVPRAESGSPTKSKGAPWDPERPVPAMSSETLEGAVRVVYAYERLRGYAWKRGESERNQQGIIHQNNFL